MSAEILKKWDHLFEQLKKFVEEDLPALEEAIIQSTEQIKHIDSKTEELRSEFLEELEKRDDQIKKITERVENLEKLVDSSKISELIKQVLSSISFQKKYKEDLENLKLLISDLENKIEEINASSVFNEISQMKAEISRLSESLGQVDTISEEASAKELEKLSTEMAELKNAVAQISMEIGQLKNSVSERYWVSKERKTESKSPRIL